MSARERRAKDRKRSTTVMRRAAGPVVVAGVAAMGLAGPAISSAQAPTVTVSEVANLNTTPVGADPGDFTNVNGQMYFTATSPAAGTELGTSNGSPAGSSLVDIIPGSTGSRPADLTNAGGRLFFYAENAAGTAEQLWTSNGTAASTVDLGGGVDITNGYPMTNIGTDAYFLTTGTGGVDELWSSDGTPAGTQGATLASALHPSELTAAGTELYFVADGTANGTAGAEQIWSTTGPGVAPEQVTQFTAASSISDLTNVAGTLYFAANGGSGEQVWTANASSASAVTALTSAGYVDHLTADGSTVFFTADNANASTTQLYVTNGTPAGTVDLATVTNGYDIGAYYPDLTNVDGTIYYAAQYANGYVGTLWSSNGTPAGTHVVSPNNATRVYEHGVRELTNADGILYYEAPTQNGPGVFTPNGTAPAIQAFTFAGSALDELSTDGTDLYFAGHVRGDPNVHLWTSNGTSAGTQVADAGIEAGATDGSYPSDFTADGSDMYFSTSNSEGSGLWISNGAASGTTKIQLSGAPSRYGLSDNLTNVNGETFFTDSYYGRLYETNGTAAGISQIPFTNAEYPYAQYLTNVGGQLFFTADGVSNGTTGETQMWVSNGSANGTLQLTPLTGSSVYGGPVAVGSEAFFFSATNSGALSLYESNGTSAGTTEVTNLPAGLTDIADATAVGPDLYFSADDNNTYQLWVSNGTTAGTVPLANLPSPGPRSITNVNGTAFFAGGGNLESSNGTAAGTGLVAADVDPEELTNDGGTLYFAGSNGAPDGEGLWRSDGSPAGTSLVKDTDPGGAVGDSYVYDLTNANGTLAFGAFDPTHGTELWTSNGTAAGTGLADDVNPGTGFGFSAEGGIANAGSTVYFSGDNGTDGLEPWTAIVPAAPTPPPVTTTTGTTPTPTPTPTTGSTTTPVPTPTPTPVPTPTTSTPVATTTTGTTTPVTTPPVKHAKVTLKAFKAGATSISLSLSCPVGGEKCTIKGTLEIVETFRNGKLSAIAAEVGPMSQTKTKTTRKTVILASAHVTLNPGKTTTLKLGLDKAATSLISTHKTLKVALHITQSAKTTFPLLTRTITLKAAPKKTVTKK